MEDNNTDSEDKESVAEKEPSLNSSIDDILLIEK